MKRIELVIDLDTLDRFTEAAKALNLSDFDVTEVRRTPRSSSRERQRLYRGREFVLDLVERLKIDLSVADDAATRIAARIDRKCSARKHRHPEVRSRSRLSTDEATRSLDSYRCYSKPSDIGRRALIAHTD